MTAAIFESHHEAITRVYSLPATRPTRTTRGSTSATRMMRD
ncbi:hypothetical protein I547_4010 [Mycobacterium kansasii 824]|uniref:Uncharacterized protein n=1 Tax=Mycobacterium kansasii TaxID=1768 RepID=A0A1V3XI56_MYCKA|nr:hypothetical protein I547_4010 [Mycobacterium kansasii 824]OOK78879.1 hypothetical protein BZL30_2096 [Mycobacterium kansasii]